MHAALGGHLHQELVQQIAAHGCLSASALKACLRYHRQARTKETSASVTFVKDPERPGRLRYTSSSCSCSCLQSPSGDATPLNIVDFLPPQTPNPELSRFLNNPALGTVSCSWKDSAGRYKALPLGLKLQLEASR